jgi:fluoride exporter
VIYLLVGVGGAIGAMARHGVNHLVHSRLLASRFPWGIVIVNVAGSFVIGLLSGLLVSAHLSLGYSARAFVIVGVLGGFTTFSSFSFDTLALAKDGFAIEALANVVGQVGLSLLAVWLGYALGLSRT